MRGPIGTEQTAHRTRERRCNDTFTGRTEPSEFDVSVTRLPGSGHRRTDLDPEAARVARCEASLDGVRVALTGTAYPTERIRFVVGPVEDTLPLADHEAIAMLRLDTDWYESTRTEMDYPSTGWYPALS